MGRQSARIYFNGQDHKDMVVWDGSKYVYHDKAYIWNGSEYELVWEKLYGLKLLYESLLPIDPVSSENNKYLYFTEDGDGSVIYQIKINDKNPEPEEHYTSDKYTVFSAPVSSRGIGIHRTARKYAASSYDYTILDLETGGIGEVDTFDFYEETGMHPEAYQDPILINQEVSPAESGMGHNYASLFQVMNWGATYQEWNYLTFIAITGISAMVLDNRSGTGTYIGGLIWDLGRLNDGGPRGLMPRFLRAVQDGSDDVFSVIEYGAGTSHGLYSVTFYENTPFTMVRVAGGGWDADRIKIVRNEELPILASDNHIWFVKVNTDDFEFIDTGIESETSSFDVSPDHKYAITSEWWNRSAGTKYFKIVEIKTGKTIVDITDEIKDLRPTQAFFVGHKCFFIRGYYGETSFSIRYRLYKWR